MVLVIIVTISGKYWPLKYKKNLSMISTGLRKTTVILETFLWDIVKRRYVAFKNIVRLNEVFSQTFE